MKKLNYSLATIIVIFALAIFACKKDRGNTTNSSAQNAKEFTAMFGAQVQRLSMTPTTAKTFTLKGGTKITIPANAFRKNGVLVTGEVSIEAMEMLKRSDVLFSGTNTNHISGAPLASDGFIYLNVKVNGDAVDKALAVPINISIPAKRTGVTQIWEGVEQVGDAQQMAWQAPQPAANGVQIKRDAQSIGDAFVFDMGNLGWINCDVFYSYTNPKTTTTVTLTNNPGTLATFRGFSGETFVFFCAKGSNVAAQLYTPNGTNSVKSYDNVMPIGVEGKYLSFAIKDGRYYYAEQETTIVANQAITLNLVETTETAVQNAINSLDGY